MTETLTVAGVLLLIAALDAMFAGFRASCGRIGLVRHRRADVFASRRGLALGVLLVGPVATATAADAAVLGVEPAAGRRWCRRQPRPHRAGRITPCLPPGRQPG